MQLSNRKKRTCGINFFLIEDGKPSFYTENIPFSSSTIFSSSPTLKLVSCHALPRLKTLSDSAAFRQGLYNHAKMPHPGQSHNVVIYMRWHQTGFPIGRMWVRSSQSPVSLSLISFYTPDIFVHALCCCVHDFSRYTSIFIRNRTHSLMFLGRVHNTWQYLEPFNFFDLC